MSKSWSSQAIDRLRRHLARRPGPPGARQPPRPRLEIQNEPDVTYAIGDIHGCFDKLLALEDAIVRDARGMPGSKLLVFLGDYIDRGPDSAAVVQHLLNRPPEGFQRIWLCGNHEAALIDYLDGRLALKDWLPFGAERTLLSYGYDIGYRRSISRIDPAGLRREIGEVIPARHQSFLRKLPVSFATPTHLFVHAGVNPGQPLDAQSDDDLLWIREPFLSQPNPDFRSLVVHGHTPTPEPVVKPWRIGVDTGACSGGPLTAARLTKSHVAFIQDS